MRRHAVLADAGPLYASVDPDDQSHERARTDAQRLASESYTVVVTYPTLFESYSLVYQRLGLDVAHTFLTELRRRSALLTPMVEDYVSASAIPLRYADQRLSLFDTLLSVVSGRLGLPVWTFDSDFDLVGADVWR